MISSSVVWPVMARVRPFCQSVRMPCWMAIPQGGGGHFLEHRFAEGLGDHQQLADRHAPGVAGLVALVAAGAPPELGFGDQRFGHHLELAGRRFVGLGAMRADPRTSRRPMTPRTLEASMNGSISMLIRRVNAPAETPEWMVLMTRCPVRPACTAIAAVSGRGFRRP